MQMLCDARQCRHTTYVHALGLAPLLCLVGGYTTLILLINLVAKYYEGEVLGITGACLDKELISPAVELLERLHKGVVSGISNIFRNELSPVPSDW
jgi:hypothetical protein